MPSEPRWGRKNSTAAFAPLGLTHVTTNSDPWLTPWATICRPLRGLVRIRIERIDYGNT
jgi:hypothetical protein